MRLSVREIEVLGLVYNGDSNREIAKKLGIGETTVKGYVTKILKAKDVDSRLKLLAQKIKEEKESVRKLMKERKELT